MPQAVSSAVEVPAPTHLPAAPHDLSAPLPVEMAASQRTSNAVSRETSVRGGEPPVKPHQAHQALRDEPQGTRRHGDGRHQAQVQPRAEAAALKRKATAVHAPRQGGTQMARTTAAGRSAKAVPKAQAAAATRAQRAAVLAKASRATPKREAAAAGRRAKAGERMASKAAKASKSAAHGRVAPAVPRAHRTQA